uniref:DDE-1 domain-containing protein n=1 Tax=Amphimedon queenslandica TaxID=400682 RepID=A0A1X7UPU3_AMPQE
MDETPLWLDMPGETTVTHSGDRSVSVRSTGVRPIRELDREPGIIVAYSKNGWMNEELTKDWVRRGWGALSFERRLLVWDTYRCNLMDSVKSVVDRKTQSDIVIIPGGLTGLVQPADVSWNKPFKTAYKELYNE